MRAAAEPVGGPARVRPAPSGPPPATLPDRSTVLPGAEAIALADLLDASVYRDGITLTAGGIPQFGLEGERGGAGGSTPGASMSTGDAVALPPAREEVLTGPILLAVALLSVVTALLTRAAVQGRRRSGSY